jgi:hypothetical protein
MAYRRTILGQEVEQVSVELSIVRAWTFDHKIGLIFLVVLSILILLSMGWKTWLYSLLGLLQTTMLTFMIDLTMPLEAFLEHLSMDALICSVK